MVDGVRFHDHRSLLMTMAEAGVILGLTVGILAPAAVSQTPSRIPVSAVPDSTSNATPNRGSDVSFTDWSDVRIKAYKEALEKPFPSPMAVLTVPRLGLRAPLFEGTDNVTLDRGLGRIAGTAHPDETGNLGIAGHRDGFFRPLKDIREGDTIEVATPAQIAVYSVDRVEIVDPNDVRVLKSSSKSTLTLVTCYPFYFYGHAPKRYIVEASLMRSSPRP